jgi:23S rRNA (guanosine2251-2'-O)-methyltransferase
MEKKEIIFGRNPVLEYLKQIKNSGDAVLFVSNTAHGKIIDIIVSSAREKRIRTEFCGKDDLHKFEPSSRHQGVVLELARSGQSISGIGRLEDFLAEAKENRGIIVLLDQLTDPHNVGSIIRTAEALGGAGVILTKAHSADITSTTAKTSAGATAYLPIYTVSNAASFIDNAKKAGFWIIGTSDKGNIDPGRIRELKPAVIIIGSEGEGMRRLTEEKCDYIAAIPLKGHIASLNASVAAGIVLYEALK